MKTIVYSLCLLLVAGMLSGCKKPTPDPDPKPDPDPNPQKSLTVEQRVDNISQLIWSSSAVNASPVRKAAILDSLQMYLNSCAYTTFKEYMKMSASDAASAEKKNLGLCFYKKSFDKVLKEVKSDTPADGETHIWLLYNMGYIIKTSKVCFGVDIYHRYADLLEPYLDFLFTSHHHYDHYTTSLLKTMHSNGKETAANSDFANTATVTHFLTNDPTYTKVNHFVMSNKSKSESIHVHSFTTDHYHSTKFYVSTYEMDLNTVGGALILMHVGDSNYDVNQYQGKIYAAADAIKVFISKYPPNEASYQGVEKALLSSVVKPKYLLYSHFNELGHQLSTSKEIRWIYPNGFNRAATIGVDGLTVCLPVWGDKMVWKGGVLN